MDIASALHDAVWAHHLTASNGATLWVPYLRNDDFTENPNVPRGLGKATPEEILESVEHIITRFPEATGEEIRQKLVDGSIPEMQYNYKGVDCSGFTYHVMNRVYGQLLHKELMDDLSVPKDHVLNGAWNLEEWKAAHPLTQQEADRLPEDVPMRWVVETFHRKPQNLCRVRGLVSDYSSIAIEPKDMRVGDLVYVGDEDNPIPHVCIVYEVTETEAQLAHSTRKNGDIGGVVIEKVPRDAEGIPDTMQLFSSPHHFIAIRRLKSLI